MAARRLTLSVRTRIVSAILVVAALGLALAGAISYAVQRQHELGLIDEKLRASVHQVQHVAELGDIDGEQYPTVADLVRASLERIVIGHNSSMVGVIEGSARFVPAMEVSFRIEDSPEFINRITEEVAAAGGNDSIIGTAQLSMGTLRYLAIPISSPNDLEQGIIITAYNLDAELAQLTSAWGIYLIASIGVLAAIAGVGVIVSGRLLRPVRTLQRAAERISASDLSERIPVRGNDDVSQLTATVNQMLDRIESGVSGQQQLVDDVRHELRTPITILRGHLELLDASNPAEVREVTALVLEELDRMNGLVTDLTALAETDRRHLLAFEWVELSQFVSQLQQKATALSESHSWRFDSELAGYFWFDPQRITQALLQLLENAVKYSGPHAVITVSAITSQRPLGASSTSLVFGVSDMGEAIPAEQAEKIFERFVRLDKGRGTSGSGLGLSIVQQIAEAHGGIATLQQAPGGGNEFLLQLPLFWRADAPEPAEQTVTPDVEREREAWHQS